MTTGYLTQWDGTRGVLVEVLAIPAPNLTITVANLGDTLLTPTDTETPSMSPHTVTGTPTLVLF